MPETWVNRLDAADRGLIAAALREAVDGPYFADWEFSALFGLERDQVAMVASRWPEPDEAELQSRAVSQSLNNLIGYPHGYDDRLRSALGTDRDGLRALLDRVNSAKASDR